MEQAIATPGWHEECQTARDAGKQLVIQGVKLAQQDCAIGVVIGKEKTHLAPIGTDRDLA